jgi:hypothetical protein
MHATITEWWACLSQLMKIAAQTACMLGRSMMTEPISVKCTHQMPFHHHQSAVSINHMASQQFKHDKT